MFKSWFQSTVGALTVLALAVLSGVGSATAGEAPTGAVQVAQLNFQIRGGNAAIVRQLERAGFSKVRITKSGFSSVQAEGCQDGALYSINYKRLGNRVRRGAKIGECRPKIDIAGVVAQLQGDGYRRITVDDSDDNKFLVTACQGNNRFDLTVSQYGDVTNRDRIGRCGGRLNLAQVRQQLRDDKYNRIRQVRQNNRVIVVEACRRNTKYRLRIARRNGEVRRRREVGDCPRPIKSSDIAAVVLRAKPNYDRVSVTDDALPRYEAQACTPELKLVRIAMNRWGGLGQETVVGECDAPLARADLVSFLDEAAFNRYEINEQRNGSYLIEACQGERRFEIIMTKYGEVSRRTQTGDCSAAMNRARLVAFLDGEKLNRYEIDERRDGSFRVTACDKLDRVRLRLTRWGDVERKRVIGDCTPPPSLYDISDKLGGRLTGLEFYAEGCNRRGRKMRVTLN
ncbi:MAG: hypothetical protein AAGF32_07880, partial [Pseudomonadota bacterium]